ncbi:rhomboid family intramembrane serine protease [uncultured Oscillibacter sp.]|uniref:rhomboid family intramembrane serine protease n=1 Tax=uncultured Oscillibacter sp. TaxID=876091 RepID=UPI0025CF0B94|nr:rhomboid family intramembrane serine protease [uncultured Oscillibacter sp.]
MRKLNSAMERFALRHPNFGIPNLMRFIIIGNAAMFFLLRMTNGEAVYFLGFEWGAVLRGQIWRLVSFIFVPESLQPFNLILSLYFMWFIGTMLEREWGTPKFNLYYLSGVVLTILTGIISHYAFGYSFILGTYYVGMSMFLAFAALYPDAQLMLLYIIPVKAKWLALADIALFAVDAAAALLRGSWLSALLPVVALLNFLVFFWCDIVDQIDRRRSFARHRNSHQTIQFKSAVRQQRKKESQQGYRHKCSVCGRTDTEYPDLEFRYCSKCAGYHCFCMDHILDHEHFKE